MEIIQLSEARRLTVDLQPDGEVRLGMEWAREDYEDNLYWDDPDGSWANLSASDVAVLVGALKRTQEAS